ncbi:hypothetical protein BH23DEI1_BH23DEI1_19430 [soil metagenome]
MLACGDPFGIRRGRWVRPFSVKPSMLSSRHMSQVSVLVVEHDPMQRQLVDLLFSVDTFALTIVGTGEEALAYLREQTPAAVIMATDLPDVPGATICQKLKSVTRLSRVPVVLVAPEPEGGGPITDGARRDARLAGADLLVQKPLGDKNLRERVQRLLTTRPDDTGLTPAAVNATSVLELDAVMGMTRVAGVTRSDSEASGHPSELARLREENAGLKTRLAKYKQRVKELQETLEEERRRPRGLFGRRT